LERFPATFYHDRETPSGGGVAGASGGNARLSDLGVASVKESGLLAEIDCDPQGRSGRLVRPVGAVGLRIERRLGHLPGLDLAQRGLVARMARAGSEESQERGGGEDDRKFHGSGLRFVLLTKGEAQIAAFVRKYFPRNWNHHDS
jgi:hypothetical protein